MISLGTVPRFQNIKRLERKKVGRGSSMASGRARILILWHRLRPSMPLVLALSLAEQDSENQIHFYSKIGSRLTKVSHCAMSCVKRGFKRGKHWTKPAWQWLLMLLRQARHGRHANLVSYGGVVFFSQPSSGRHRACRRDCSLHQRVQSVLEWFFFSQVASDATPYLCSPEVLFFLLSWLRFVFAFSTKRLVIDKYQSS